MKKLVRLTESDIHKIVRESVKRVLREASGSLDSGYSNQFMDNDGFYKDMGDDEIRNTKAYKIAYEMLDDYAYERGDEPMDEWETCHDIMEHTRIPQNIVWFAISDWKDANNVG